MMRGFALLAGLLLGLAGAIAWGGRLAHLRALADLPGWTQGLDADSGLFAGSGTLDDAALRWVWTAGSGWVVTLSGRDWQAQGRAHPRPDGVRIDALSGLVPLALLTGGAGALAVERGTLALGWDGVLRDGWIDGRGQGGAVGLAWRNGWQPVSP